MIIIEPAVELWKQDDRVSHVAKCARVCYGNEFKGGNDEKTYKALESSNHWSMFRHETYYACIPCPSYVEQIYKIMDLRYRNCPYIEWFRWKYSIYIIINGNALRDLELNDIELYTLIQSNLISPLEASSVYYLWQHHMRYTFYVTTQISTSRELNRCKLDNCIA